MAKSAWITNETKNKLRMTYVKICQRNKKPPLVRDFIEELNNLNENDRDFQKEFGKGFIVPSKSWFDKKENIPMWRKAWEQLQINPLKEDLPWHLHTLNDYPVPADAIPIILEIEKKIDKNITIRVVKWFTRLYIALKGVQFLNLLKGKEFPYFFYCYIWALMYAEREQISELSDTSFDSSDLDAGLLDDDPLSLLGGGDLSPESARLWLRFVETVLGWLMGEQNLISKEEKQHIAELFVSKIEEGLAEHSLGGWNKESVHYADVLLLYLLAVLSALESGYFHELSSDQRQAQLMKIREKLPQLLKAPNKTDFESFKKFFEKFWGDLKIEKEG